MAPVEPKFQKEEKQLQLTVLVSLFRELQLTSTGHRRRFLPSFHQCAKYL
jgi:hypothetical protein